MISGLLGKKLGMSQVFQTNGAVVPVTLVQVGPCIVTQLKGQAHDGYQAVQVGFEEVKRLNQPERGHLKRVGKLFRHLKEFQVSGDVEVQPGQVITVTVFKPGDRVDVIGTSKGRGFAGGVKRHHFRGGPKTHGQSDRLRAPGSIGATTSPGRVLKGLRMAGHMGAERITVQDLEVVAVVPEQNQLYVKGAVPGYRGSLVAVQFSKKASKKSATSPQKR
jgi:large subunit ribosomal protein L3